jgi:hypothetical protein
MWCVVLFALVPNMQAQEATPDTHTGVPQDWSQRQIVFSRDALAQHPDLIYREPRVLHQAMQRWQVPNWGSFHGVEPLPVPAKKHGIHRDWNVGSLGGSLRKNAFPAKFSYDAAAPPDCTNDYAVFGLGVAGAIGGQANLVGFNNLYSDPVNGGGFCDPPTGPGLGPLVLFAYNISTATTGPGKILTSPVLSESGKKIAFVESVTGPTPSAIFHVLTWNAGEGTIGTIGHAFTPTTPQMISLPFSANAGDIYSSPWVDYATDTAYVGADNGIVYKITGVFHGTPTLSGSPWPVTVHIGFHVTAPVLDSNLGMLMLGNFDGFLYQININSPTLAVHSYQIGVTGGPGSGIAGPPIVDITNGTTFVVTGNVVPGPNTGAALVEFDTASLTPLSTGPIGIGGTTGAKLRLLQPAFSNDYYNGLTTGVVTLCGTGAGDTSPWQYVFGFDGRVMHTPSSFSQQLLPSTAAQCSGWTEFFNPNVGPSPGTDFFFFGLTQDCTAPGSGTAGGCVEEIRGATHPVTATVPVNDGPSGIIIDNYSTESQASSIYLGSVFAPIVYKFTQDGLQ